jgi:hypothetical protein
MSQLIERHFSVDHEPMPASDAYADCQLAAGPAPHTIGNDFEPKGIIFRTRIPKPISPFDVPNVQTT